MATQAELYQHAINAGATPQEAQLLAAVAMAESGGQSVKSGVDPNSWGPWQVNLDAHPQYSLASVMNPATAAQAAVAILRSQGPSAWSMYTNGGYQQYMGGGAAGGSPMTQAPIDYADFVNQGGIGGTTNAGGISGAGGTTFRVVDLGNGMSVIMMRNIAGFEQPLGGPFKTADAAGGMTPYQSAQLGLSAQSLAATQQSEAANLAEKMREFNETKAAQDIQFRDRSAIDWQKLNWDNIHADQNLAERKAEFAQTFGLDYDKFQESKRQFDQQFGLDIVKLSQQNQQFQQSQAQQLQEFNSRLTFDIQSREQDVAARQQDLAEKQREFNAAQGLERERLGAEIAQRQAELGIRQQELAQQMSIAQMDNSTKLQIAGQQMALEREKMGQQGSQFQQSEAEKKREFDLRFNQDLATQNAQMAQQRLELLLKGVGNDPMRQALLTEGVGGNIGTTPQEQAVMQIMRQFPLSNTSGLSLQDMAMGGVPAAAVGGPVGQGLTQPAPMATPPMAPGAMPPAPMPTAPPAVAPMPAQGRFNPAYAAQFAPTQPAHMAMGGTVPAVVGERGPELGLLAPGSAILPLHMRRGSTYAEQDRKARMMYPDMMSMPVHAAQGYNSHWFDYYLRAMQEGRPDQANAIQQLETRGQFSPENAATQAVIHPAPTASTQRPTQPMQQPVGPVTGANWFQHYLYYMSIGRPDLANRMQQAGAGIMPTPTGPRVDPNAGNPYPTTTPPPAQQAGNFPAPAYGLQAQGPAYQAPPAVMPYTPTTEEVAKYRAAHPLNPMDIAARAASATKGKGIPTPMNGPKGINSPAPTHMATGGYTVNSTNYYPGQPSPTAPTGTYASGGVTYQRVVYPDGSVHYVNPSAPVPTAPKPPTVTTQPVGTPQVVTPPAPPAPPTPPPLGVYGTTALALSNAQGMGNYNPQRFGGLPSLGTAYGVPVLAPEMMAARYPNLPLPVQNLYQSALGIAGLPWEEAQRRMMAATPVGVSSLVGNQGVVNPFRYGREAVTYG